MEVSQATRVASAKPIRPHPKVVKKGAVPQVAGGDCDSGEDMKNHCDSDGVNAIIAGMTQKMKKASGNSNQRLHEAIKKWSILDSSTAKAALSGPDVRVTDWVNIVDCVTGSQKSLVPSSLLSGSIPLPSTVNTTSSVNTRATSASYTGPPPMPGIPNNCAGGYGDIEQDDSQKRAATILASLAKGKRLPEPPTQTWSTSIVEVTATEVVKELPAPSLKRKGPEIEYVLSSEQEGNIGKQEDIGAQDEEEDDEAYDPEEEVEEASQLPAWLYLAGSLHKMNATSVTITEKPSKKAKLESSKSQVQLSTSHSTTATSNAQSSAMTTPDANASTGQRFNTTSLSSSFSKDGKWRKTVITTLCLWSGSQPDVWNISKQEISDALKEILLVVYPELLHVAQDLNASSAPVTVAYQCLCEWRHGVGSAAIALFTSFFAGSSEDDI
ncbi:hypothetical protein PAXINDRAFT_16764 [Paxillus involutus ATCC 200175]|uniref:Unplaced genomic scaffold PAXINscaffold_91, whole genome shotgun sequence n=1 Tax=Paxillus involutus ATCC 200175 TaxID=664439 RepID=A0A0C9T3N5_PAXIN|nr:hypothetical protein PAXINDRAFT_16764 [Paxillus involutus ATCC 200175]